MKISSASSVLLLFLQVLYSASSQAHELFYVDANLGSDNNDGLTENTAFLTIKKAISSLQWDGHIVLACGYYGGPDNRGIHIEDGRSLIIESSCPDRTQCIMDCGGSDQGFHLGGNANFTVRGFSIINGDSAVISQNEDGGCINFRYVDQVLVENMRLLSSHSGSGGGGLTIEYTQSPAMVRNVEISGNNCDVKGGGVELYSAEVIFQECQIVGNNAPSGRDIWWQLATVHIDSSSTIGDVYESSACP